MWPLVQHGFDDSVFLVQEHGLIPGSQINMSWFNNFSIFLERILETILRTTTESSTTRTFIFRIYQQALKKTKQIIRGSEFDRDLII